jgi:hypothetical protein
MGVTKYPPDAAVVPHCAASVSRSPLVSVPLRGPTPEVGPGDLAVPREDDRTRWTVRETPRKACAISR